MVSASSLTAPAVSAAREWADKYPRAPRYAEGELHRRMAVDGTRLSIAVLPGPPDAPADVVVVHGILNSSRSPKIYEFAHHLAEHFRVIVPDLRGHGASEGECTFGLLEPLDVAAAVELARPERPVVTIGTSLGAAAVLMHAGLFSPLRPLAGVVSVSAPGYWGDTSRPGAHRALQFATSRWRRLSVRALTGAHLAPPRVAVGQIDLALAGIRAGFVVLAHDPSDGYFGPDHALHLHAHVGAPSELWWLPGAGHGSDVLGAAFSQRVIRTIRNRIALTPQSCDAETARSGALATSERGGRRGLPKHN